MKKDFFFYGPVSRLKIKGEVMGKRWWMIRSFLGAIAAGKTAMYLHPKYVLMDKETYLSVIKDFPFKVTLQTHYYETLKIRYIEMSMEQYQNIREHKERVQMVIVDEYSPAL